MSSPFYFITDSHEKVMLETAYNAVTSLELWDYMKNPTKSYMCSSDKELDLIINKIVELGYSGHSGGSFGYTMREMQYIAQHDLSQYKRLKCGI